MKSPTKPCHACNGTGTESLAARQSEVLKVFRSRKQPSTLAQIRKDILKKNGSVARNFTDPSCVHWAAKWLCGYGKLRKVRQVREDSDGKRCCKPTWEYEAV